MENKDWCIKLTEENNQSVISYLENKYKKNYYGFVGGFYGELNDNFECRAKAFCVPISFEQFKEMLANDLKSQIVGTISDNLDSSKHIPFLQGLENDTKEIQGTPNYYDNSKGSLYQFAEHHKLNAWEFDIVKRIVRCREKGNFIEDLEKTKKVIDLYLLEYGK